MHAISAALVMLTVGAAPLWAQDVVGGVDEPVIAEWIQILLIIALTAMMLGVSMLSSKRGHRD